MKKSSSKQKLLNKSRNFANITKTKQETRSLVRSKAENFFELQT